MYLVHRTCTTTEVTHDIVCDILPTFDKDYLVDKVSLFIFIAVGTEPD